MPYLPGTLSLKHRFYLWRARISASVVFSMLALTLSLSSFYYTYLYQKDDLQVTAVRLDRKGVDGQGAVEITFAFANTGNRHAALLDARLVGWTQYEIGRGWLYLPDTEALMPISYRPDEIGLVTLQIKDFQKLLKAKDLVLSGQGPERKLWIGVKIKTMRASGGIFDFTYPILYVSVFDKPLLDGTEVPDEIYFNTATYHAFEPQRMTPLPQPPLDWKRE